MSKKKSTKKRRPGRRRAEGRHPFTLRLRVATVEALDEIADEAGISRTELIDRTLAMAVEMHGKMESSLFGDEFESLMESVMTSAIKRAVAEGRLPVLPSAPGRAKT